MKIKVSQNLKGKLSIPGFSKTFIAGEETDLSKDQFLSTEIQSLLSNGILESSSYKKEDSLQFINKTKNKVVLPWGQIVGPNEVFNVNLEKSSLAQFSNIIKDGLVSRFEGNEAIKKDDKKTSQKTAKDVDKNKKLLKDVVASQKLPKETYIHDPSKKTELYVEDKIQEINNELEEGNFVDKKQVKEKLLKMQRNIRKTQ